jgi:hypothetical protein
MRAPLSGREGKSPFPKKKRKEEEILYLLNEAEAAA